MRWTLAVVLVAAALGCRLARRANVPSGPGDRHGTLPSGGGIPDAGRAFDDRVYDYRLTIAPVALARLDAEPARFDDEALHVPAKLVIDGEDLGTVGVRYKGAWGTFRSCLPNPDGTGPAEPYRPIAASDCPPVPKFSYKILFDAYASGKRFHGLTRMNLHNLIRDPSKLHERLAFELFRDLGIATARSTFARVTVNGVYKGLSAATEDIGNRRFLADHWPADRHGRLYKQGWPRVTDPDYWERALSTPKRVDDHQAIVGFAGDV